MLIFYLIEELHLPNAQGTSDSGIVEIKLYYFSVSTRSRISLTPCEFWYGFLKILLPCRELVVQYKPAYDSNSSLDYRMALAKKIVDQLRPGRFLKLDDAGTYRVVDYQSSVTKVSYFSSEWTVKTYRYLFTDGPFCFH